jgi:hypothetical protein
VTGNAAPDAVAQVRRLLDEALEAYADDPVAGARLQAHRDRLDEPLRVAIAGRVKAGKSTLLNGLVGERLAPTDAGECTRVVTWYRRGVIPRVVLHPVEGPERVLPVHRQDGALQLELDGTEPGNVERLVVDWPTGSLAELTLIDTPGISSLSVGLSDKTRALLEDEELPGADAVVFLTRQMQPDDLAFLRRFQEATGGAGVQTTTITVLSRADEIGGGSLDALLAAAKVARRTAEDPEVRALSHAVVPVCGLLGLAGRSLRHRDFVALRSLATADRRDLESMLLTADRFVRPEAPVPVSRELRESLLERLGPFGIRLAVALIRTGVPTADALASELVRRSGLDELQRLLAVHFTQRGAALRVGTSVRMVERLLRERPPADGAALAARAEAIRLGCPELAELELLARLRAVEAPFSRTVRAQAERLLGAEGDGIAARLGLPEDSSVERRRRRAEAELARWRERASDPLARRPAADAADLLVRTCEAMLSALDGPEPVAAAGGSARSAAQPSA